MTPVALTAPSLAASPWTTTASPGLIDAGGLEMVLVTERPFGTTTFVTVPVAVLT